MEKRCQALKKRREEKIDGQNIWTHLRILQLFTREKNDFSIILKYYFVVL